MNASEQATTLELASKIAAVVNLFKFAFPDARADLEPWMNEPETQDLIDPDSIDIGFHFPGQSRSFRSRSVLVQIRLHQDPVTQAQRAIGVEILGFDHRGEQWRLPTVGNWQFLGQTKPVSEVCDLLKQFCHQIFELFNGKP